jgi:very-short-patch-repair endonuclease
MLQGDVPQARRLRREMSLPEVLLWQQLQQRPGGYKFRKKHPAGRLTVDFDCHQSRLIIEVDGEAHNRGDRPERDAKRDLDFASKGIVVRRVAATDVLRNMEGVLLFIVAEAQQRGDPLRPRPSTARSAA